MKSILIWIAMGSLLATFAEAQPASYTVIDLGTLKNGPFSIANGESLNGIVNGVSGLPNGTQHAVLWYRGSVIDLATPDSKVRTARHLASTQRAWLRA